MLVLLPAVGGKDLRGAGRGLLIFLLPCFILFLFALYLDRIQQLGRRDRSKHHRLIESTLFVGIYAMSTRAWHERVLRRGFFFRRTALLDAV